MIKFVIVDDEDIWIEKYKEIINKELFKTDRDYEIFTYKKYNSELKKMIKDTSEQKVYLMDLELDHQHDGMEILREIREDDWDSEIIVLTNHDRMFERVHKEIYKTFDFIEKFDSLDMRLKADLKKIILKKYDVGKFVYSNKKISLEIYMKDIIYICRDTIDRKLIIKTTNNEFYIKASFLSIMKQLDGRFVQCHRACIINNDRIQEKNYSKGYFLTDTGEKINMLSRKNKSEVNEN